MTGDQLKERLQHLLGELNKLSQEELNKEVLVGVDENGYSEEPQLTDLSFEIEVESQVSVLTILKDRVEQI